jgi:hypothetical protein
LSLVVVLPPAETVELLDRRLAMLNEEAAEISATVRRARVDDVHWVFLIEEEYRLATLKTEQRFVKDLIEKFSKPGYVREWNEWMKHHGGST